MCVCLDLPCCHSIEVSYCTCGDCVNCCSQVGMLFILPFPFVLVYLDSLCVKWSASPLNDCCLWSIGLWHLISYVVFCCNWGHLHVSFGSCGFASYFGHLYLLASAVVVIRSIPYYCSMDPGPASSCCTTIGALWAEREYFYLHLHMHGAVC